MLLNLHKLVIENGRLKVTALVMAVAIWFYANGQLKETTSFVLPVRFELPDGYVLLHQSVKTVVVQTEGPRFLVDQVAKEVDRDMHALTKRLTVEDVQRQTRHSFDIRPEWISTLSQRRFVQLRFDVSPPGEVEVWASRVVTAQLPVAASISPQSTETRSTMMEPEKVTFTGPELLLDHMREVPTAPLEVLRDVDQIVDLRQEVTVKLADDVQVAVPFRTSPRRARVKIEVVRDWSSRTIDGVPVQLLPKPIGFPYEVELENKAQTVSVTFNGLPRDLQRIQPEDIIAVVNVKDLSAVAVPPNDSRLATEKVRLVRGDDDAAAPRITPPRVNLRLTNPKP